TDRDNNHLAHDVVIRFFVLPGDANGDGVTNDLDVFLVLRQIGRTGTDAAANADLNGDGRVTTADLDIVRTHYLTRLPAGQGAGGAPPADPDAAGPLSSPGRRAGGGAGGLISAAPAGRNNKGGTPNATAPPAVPLAIPPEKPPAPAPAAPARVQTPAPPLALA